MDALPLNLARPEVPIELAALVARMMAKEPERRFQTPKDVALALSPFFKTGIAGTAGRPAEMSQPGRAEQDRAATRVLSIPAQRTAETAPSSAKAPSAAPPVVTPSAAPAAVTGSEGLIEFQETRTVREPHGAVAAANRRPQWLWPGAAAGLLLLGLAVAWPIYTSFPGGNRSIVIENEPKGRETPGGLDKITASAVDSSARTQVDTSPLPSASAPASVDERVVAPNAETQPSVGLTVANQPDLREPQPTVPDRQPRPIKNTIGMMLTPIPAGEFMMGSPEDDTAAAPAEKPRHRVRISSFYLGVTEVTQSQYEAVMGNNPSHFSSTGDGRDKIAGRPAGQHPVDNVSWLDAVHFCDTLSKREGRSPFYSESASAKVSKNKSSGYRLPTEAEWEYACRAGTTRTYCFGNGTATLSDHGWFGAHAGGTTHPVGEKLPNAFGLFDMHGNVAEWCSDWFDDAYYQKAPASDPPGPAVGTHRVVRGGSWHRRPRGLRSAARFDEAPGRRNHVRGFRIALGQADQ